MSGVKTNNLPPKGLADEVLVNDAAGTGRQSLSNLATQLVGSGPVAVALNSLQSQITSGVVSAATWPDLLGLSASEDGAGAEVLDSDAGTHAQATATGYDGAVVNNAGRYAWNAAWGRWLRIGGTGLSGKANSADLAAVATSGDWSDLRNVPAFGTAANENADAFASATQGAKADTALQPEEVGSAAAEPVEAFATALQGEKADTALQVAQLDPAFAQDPARAEASSYFSATLTGALRPADAVGSTAADDDLGTVFVINGNTVSVTGYQDIARRVSQALEPGRLYRVRAVIKRLADPVDPNGHAIELRLQELGKSYAAVADVMIERLSNANVAAGIQTLQFTFSTDVEADHAAAASARYAVPYLRIYGADHQTAIATLDVQDVTGSYNDLSDRPDLGSAAAEDVAAFATAEQGLKADAAAPKLALDIERLAREAVERQARALGRGDYRDDMITDEGYLVLHRDPQDWPTDLVDPQTGRRAFYGLIDLEAVPYRDEYPDAYRPVFFDGQREVFIAVEIGTGRSVLDGLIDREPEPYRDCHADGMKPVMHSAGSMLLLADPATGDVYAPHVAPKQLRQGGVAFDLRIAGGFRTGYVNSAGGFTSLVRERLLSTEPVAVAVDPRPMHFAPMSGQSNAINGGAANVNPRKLVTPLYPYHFVGMASGGVATFITPAGQLFDADAVDGFLPFQDFPSANAAGAMVNYGFGIEGAYRSFGAPSPGIVGYTSAKGGSPITEHNKGTTVYSNMIAAAAQAKATAALYGREMVCHALRFIQGEGGPYVGYQALLEELADDYQADLVTALDGNNGIDPVLLISQVAVSDEVPNPVNVVPLDQVAAARNRPDTIKLDGPMYHNRMDDSGIHGATDSKAMIHEAAGYAYRQLVEEGDWTPLWSADGTATRTGAEIVIDYHVPGVDRMLHFDPGDQAFDEDGWIKPINNYGFHYADDSSGAEIASVAIESVNGFATRVRVTLTADPGAAANKVLSYARHAYDTDQDLWASARGQLRVRLELSELYAQGLPIPKYKYAYAIAEEWSV